MILFQKQFKLISEQTELGNVESINNRGLNIADCAAALEDAHVFMFKSFDAQKLVKDSTCEEVDLPFKKCVFEVKEGMFFYYTPAAEKLANKHGHQLRHVNTFLIEEVTPRKYDVYLVASSKDGKWLSFHNYKSEEDNGEEFKQILSLVQSILNSLRGTAVAKENVKETMKIKVSGKKRQICINTISHIYPDKTISPKGLHGRTLEFSHRWFVCGHWRKISGLGKGRDGVYNEEGFTWVVPHEKGPLDKELVQKVRMIHPSSVASEF